ncbi:MAG: hypothetical protein JWO37_1166 [Acidimicrobiales bacterium]|jgi:hypothetical protein|nr:hypothetical protein [Acidimicrobiales bacterium]
MSDLLDADVLVETARRETGLDDFDGDSFREGLAVYCDSLVAEARLNDVGVMALQANIVGNLANRLRITDWRSRHADVGDEALDAPVFVIGLFRAGTTLLSHLLDLDPATRSLLGWEAQDSVPPPTPDTYRSGARVDAARDRAAMMDALNPAMKAIHHEEPDGPTECIAVLSQDFKALLWESIANVPRYGAWLSQVDQRSAYEHHRRCLQVLQSGGVRGRWMLKSPHHAIALPALTAVYPDARLVYLHRDPVVVAASACSLIQCLSGTFSDADHSAYIAERWTDVLTDSVSRVDAFRDAYPEQPILDIHYPDLVGNPLTAVEAVYEFAGLPFTAPVEQAISAHLASHPRGRFGAHRYDVAGVGLSEAALRERFHAYTERYGVEPEG